MVNRMVDPTHGQVLIDDVDVATRNPVELRRSIGYVMQHAGLLPHRRVIDNVATVLLLNGVPKKEARDRAYAVLSTVGLDESLAMRYPGSCPAGSSSGWASAAAWSPIRTCC